MKTGENVMGTMENIRPWSTETEIKIENLWVQFQDKNGGEPSRHSKM
jgi:hypothetical protein